MKKIICIIMIFFSFSVFAEQKNNTWKSPENKIADENHIVMPGIRFFMNRKELEDTLKKKSFYSTQGGGGLIYAYENVRGPFNYNYSLSSFLFLSNRLMSCVFSHETTPSQHKRILETYKRYYGKRTHLTKTENKNANAILYYNSSIMLYVKYESERTMVIIQVTNEKFLKSNIEEINQLG